ncbi:uncharacterized protein B4U79_17195 [Dinothrombium tinctorium]|uniref:SH3 domain-containing protein n=1 Tax=Dinothrombium tinctorium TaxID=1965070 RepID=A0A443RLF3_9ACAR|nr:uncharacterized protein B4U79_17195 [Dinothrombium tinctorium]
MKKLTALDAVIAHQLNDVSLNEKCSAVANAPYKSSSETSSKCCAISDSSCDHKNFNLTASLSSIEDEEVVRKLSKASASNPADITMVVMNRSKLYMNLPKVDGNEKRTKVPMGMLVTALYSKNDWLYVRTPHGIEGFIQSNICTPLCSLPMNAPKKKQRQRTKLTNPSQKSAFAMKSATASISLDGTIRGSNKRDANCSTSLTPETKPFALSSTQSSSTLTTINSKSSQNSSRSPNVKCKDTVRVKPFLRTINSSNQSVVQQAQFQECELLKEKVKLESDDIEIAMRDSPLLLVINDTANSDESMHIMKVKKGEIVTLINDIKSDCIYVRRTNGEKGYIPKNTATKVAIL